MVKFSLAAIVLLLSITFTSAILFDNDNLPIVKPSPLSLPSNNTQVNITSNASEYWVTQDRGALNNVGDILHNWLGNLGWASSGHTIDTDLDINQNDIYDIKNVNATAGWFGSINATTGNFTDLYVSNSTLYIGDDITLSASGATGAVLNISGGNVSVGPTGYYFGSGQYLTDINLTGISFDAGTINASQFNGGNFSGEYDWIAEGPWLIFNGTYLYFNGTELNNTINQTLTSTGVALLVGGNNFTGDQFIAGDVLLNSTNVLEVINGNNKTKIQADGVFFSRQDTGDYSQYIKAQTADIEINSRSATRLLVNEIIRMAINSNGIIFYDAVNFQNQMIDGVKNLTVNEGLYADTVNATIINATTFNGGNYTGNHYNGTTFEVINGNNKAKVTEEGIYISRQDNGAYAQYLIAQSNNLVQNARSSNVFKVNEVTKMAINSGGIVFYDDLNFNGASGFNANRINATEINSAHYNWTTGDEWNDFDGNTLTFNESKFNVSVQDLAEVTLREEVLNVVSSGGSASATTAVLDFEIKEIKVNTTSGTQFRFEAIEATTGNTIDANRKVHTTEWRIEKNYAINDAVNISITSANPDDTFTVTFKYLNNFG